jgi:vacuolar-type H+-ATPase subunit C/Vma6
MSRYAVITHFTRNNGTVGEMTHYINAKNDEDAISELTVSLMRAMLENFASFCPMNDKERKMLETIPLLSDYENTESHVNGKNFLQKVKELHNIEISTSRALMVSLKKKQFIDIGGGKKTFITLLERGIRYLSKTA